MKLTITLDYIFKETLKLFSATFLSILNLLLIYFEFLNLFLKKTSIQKILFVKVANRLACSFQVSIHLTTTTKKTFSITIIFMNKGNIPGL